MSEVITFPSASKTSKLSASPTTKIPQSTDWIFQDFFNTMLDGDLTTELSSSIQISELFPQENMLKPTFEKHHSLLANLYETYNESDKLSLPDLDSAKNSDSEEDEDEEVYEVFNENNNKRFYNTYQASEENLSLEDLTNPPVLIESNISSVDDSSIASIPDEVMIEIPFHTLNKRKSSASFSSLKSNIMNVFHMNKKPKVQQDTLSLKKNDTTVSSKSSMSLKLKKYLKFRF